jgi:hypothetical protein
VTVLSKRNKNGVAALAEQLAAGTQKRLSTVNTIYVEGSTYTPAQVEALLQSLAKLRDSVDAAHAAYKGTLAEERSKGPALMAFFDAFVSYVEAAFRGQPEALADFGLQPKKPRKPLTAEQQAAAKAKGAATRKARGTMSKKQKLAIKGKVTGVVVTPVTEPAAANAATPKP